jgi:hypothetical protein
VAGEDGSVARHAVTLLCEASGVVAAYDERGVLVGLGGRETRIVEVAAGG